MKMNLNGTGIEVICGAHGYTVEGLDYHYRLVKAVELCDIILDIIK